jgi:hypothetical protein
MAANTVLAYGRDLERFARQIFIWADLHRRSTGQWPTEASGALPFAPRETWSGINSSLKLGRRGLPGRDTLARLLARERGVRHPNSPPRLSVEQILRWADAYQQRTGQWPRATAAPIPEAEGETWLMINRALQEGKRGLRGGASLFGLLRKRRGVTRRQSQANAINPSGAAAGISTLSTGDQRAASCTV